MHCVPSLPPGRLVAVPGAGLLRVPHLDPALLAEKAAAEADSSLAQKSLAHIQKAGVSMVQKLGSGGGGGAIRPCWQRKQQQRLTAHLHRRAWRTSKRQG
jgi:hypothetical protein